jgi:hypothetical protein
MLPQSFGSIASPLMEVSMPTASNTNRATISTIAELVFVDTPVLNFARLVGDLDAVLRRFHPQDRTMLWDCDDIAIFDVPGTRIALAYTENPRQGVAASLLIAVGPSPTPAERRVGPSRAHAVARHDVLCARLVDRMQARLAPHSTFWHESDGQLTSDLFDALCSVQPQASQGVQPKHADFPAAKAAAQTSVTPKDQDLLRLRVALYPPAEDLPPRLNSNQMRLATHTMNATLIMVSLPLGAALTTYAVLRGENMRMTTAAMVFTGLAGTLLQSDIGLQLMAMASI